MTKQTKQREALLPKEDLSKLPAFKQRFYKRFGYGFNFEPITSSVRLLEFIQEELAQAQQEAVERERERLNKLADKMWLSAPWSPEWSAENYKVEGYRRAMRDFQEALKKEQE